MQHPEQHREQRPAGWAEHRPELVVAHGAQAQVQLDVHPQFGLQGRQQLAFPGERVAPSTVLTTSRSIDQSPVAGRQSSTTVAGPATVAACAAGSSSVHRAHRAVQDVVRTR